MITSLGVIQVNEQAASAHLSRPSIYKEWWDTWDRCCAALDFKPTGCQLIAADRLRREGRTAYSAVVEVSHLVDGLDVNAG